MQGLGKFQMKDENAKASSAIIFVFFLIEV